MNAFKAKLIFLGSLIFLLYSENTAFSADDMEVNYICVFEYNIGNAKDCRHVSHEFVLKKRKYKKFNYTVVDKFQLNTLVVVFGSPRLISDSKLPLGVSEKYIKNTPECSVVARIFQDEEVLTTVFVREGDVDLRRCIDILLSAHFHLGNINEDFEDDLDTFLASGQRNN